MRTSAAFCSIHGCAVRLDTCSTSFLFVTQLVRMCGHLPRSSIASTRAPARPEALLGVATAGAGDAAAFHDDACQPFGGRRETRQRPLPRPPDRRGSPAQARSERPRVFFAGTSSVETPRLSRDGTCPDPSGPAPRPECSRGARARRATSKTASIVAKRTVSMRRLS